MATKVMTEEAGDCGDPKFFTLEEKQLVQKDFTKEMTLTLDDT